MRKVQILNIPTGDGKIYHLSCDYDYNITTYAISHSRNTDAVSFDFFVVAGHAPINLHFEIPFSNGMQLISYLPIVITQTKQIEISGQVGATSELMIFLDTDERATVTLIHS